MENEKMLPYSYHTFLFPFLWDNGGETEWNDFKKILDIGKRWIDTNWNGEEIPGNRCKDEWHLDYAAYQYFTEPARAILFNSRNDGAVHSFRYKYKDRYSNKIGKYIIVKNQSDMVLDIFDIKLNIYESGVAILIFELENYNYKTLKEVNKINEYGRRINMPYIPDGTSHTLCADEIKIKFCDDDFACENYKQTLAELDESFESAKNKMSLTYVMSPIKKLIDGGGLENGGLQVTTKKVNVDVNKFFIQPCVDDRMFVCCLIRDAKALQGLTEWIPIGESGEYSYLNDCYMKDHKFSDDFYKTIFIENEITCVSRRMKKELLKKCVYDRWIDYGTLYACTHHSMICFTGESADLIHVYNSFLTMYIQLAILVLAQRATILALSAKASKVSNELKEDKRKTTKNHLEKIEELQKKYVIAQNQLFITEATVQEQGVEIYALIREQLYINANKAELDEQMSNLRDVADIANERMEREADDKLNCILLWFTVVGCLLAFIQTILTVFSSKIIKIISQCLFIVGVFCILVFSLIKRIRRKHNGSKVKTKSQRKFNEPGHSK
ncbi:MULTISPECIES: hypothetical protein [Caproicibacterium]|uniref:Uncharacterized protein n=1 Tax=Caproicibacterium argilliputei TaxID=3030016 RepID=A0AA97DA31_9FIRM|nr:hypothetical protein [Caproicibacterium argilliputei]WOC31808.1 hypothetical protein PXC00_11505 [Caproicibacterium argilliputei]